MTFTDENRYYKYLRNLYFVQNITEFYHLNTKQTQKLQKLHVFKQNHDICSISMGFIVFRKKICLLNAHIYIHCFRK